MSLAVYFVRLLLALAEAWVIKLRMDAKQQALNLLNQIDDQTDALESKITALRSAGNLESDRHADRLLERNARRCALRSSITAGLPLLESWTDLPARHGREVVQSGASSGERPAHS